MSGESTSTLSVCSLFTRERCVLSFREKFIIFLYAPLGLLLVFVRIIIGLHVFFTARILRRAMFLRCIVLRVMSCLLGIVTFSGGPAGGWNRKTQVLVANHISTLDYVAVDLIEPCIIPSLWNVSSLLRWCLGYTRFGIGEQHSELVRHAREYCEKNKVPLLVFPEGAMTNGSVGLLKFSSWPFEVADSVQPVLISINRPFFDGVAPSVLGGAWWQDVLYLFFVPLTVIKVHWLQSMRRKTDTVTDGPDETAEEFASRVANVMAMNLGIVATSYTSQDALEEAKRHLKKRADQRFPYLTLKSNGISLTNAWKIGTTSSQHLDAVAMKIKQAFPTVSLQSIREDLEWTRDGTITCERIASGSVKDEMGCKSCKGEPTMSSSMQEWHEYYNYRKWNIIEENRSKFVHEELSMWTLWQYRIFRSFGWIFVIFISLMYVLSGFLQLGVACIDCFTLSFPLSLIVHLPRNSHT